MTDSDSQRKRVREGWTDAFRAAESSINDELLLEKVAANDFDDQDWEW